MKISTRTSANESVNKVINQAKFIKSKRIAVSFCFFVLALMYTALSYGQVVKFDLSTLPGGANNFGPSPLAATTSDANVTIVGLTRGTGIGTTGTGAGKAWGGNGFVTTNTTQALALAGNQIATFSITANTGYKVSLSDIPVYNIRRSGTGPTTGIWQYQVGAGAFTDIGTPITWGAVTTATGNDESAISLSGITALQDVPFGTTITFRVILWGSTGTAGTWYFNDPTSGTRDIIVNGTVTSLSVPTITPSGTLSAVNTTYGTASASPTNFSVTGTNLTDNILVTAPAGYEVSQTAGGASGYAATQTLTQTGGAVASTTIYARLTAAATVAGSAYSGNIVLSSTGATPVNVATVSSTVSPLAISVSGATAVDKVYDRNTNATITGATATGVNGDVLTVTGGGSFADFLVSGSPKPVTAALSLTGTNASSYTVIQPTGLTASITVAPLTIAGAQAQNKVFDGNDNAVITGTLNGVIAPDAVTFNGTGTFASSAIGNGIAVTSTATLAGADEPNYTLIQPTGLTANITPAGLTPQTITFTLAPSAVYGDDPITLNGTASSNLTVSYVSSNTSVATISGNTLTIVGAGSTNIIASQPGDGVTYAAAPDVTQPLTVSPKMLTVTGAVAQNKPYDGTTAATIDLTGANLVGIVSPDVVTVSGTGTFADANVANAITVTTSLSLGGANASRYLLTQPTGLSANINPAAQTILFAPLTAKTYGDVPFTVTATGGASGNAVTFASSDPSVATVSGNTVTITGGGTCNIIASQAASSNYAAATDVAQPLTVNKQNQTITFATLPNKTIVDAPFSLGASSTSGLLISYVSSNPSVATVAGSTVTITGLGTTTITASQGGNGNYNAATSVPQNLTVTKEVLAGWQFGSPAALGTEVTYNATTNNSNLNTAILSRGAGITPTALGRAFGSNGFSASPNTKANAKTTNQYYSFSINPKPGFLTSLATLDARLRRSGATSPDTYIWTYSTDGTNFTEIGTDVSFTSTVDGVDQPQIDLSGIAALQNIGSATTVSFRLYAWNGTATTATFSVGRYAGAVTTNSLAVTGSVLPLPAPVINSSLTASATVGALFNYTITATNNPTSFSSSTLPVNNLTINGSNGLISGTPATAGSQNILIRATNATGFDEQTLAITIAKGNQLITGLPATDTRIYGASPYNLAATGGGSNLPVTYVSSDPAVATISGNTVTITGGGTTTITASQAGDANWNAAPDVTQTLTVNKADQTITFAALPDKTSTDVPFNLTATASSGLAVSYASSNPAVATIAGNTVTITGIGSTIITASQAGDINYNAAPDVSQTQLVINGALQNQTINFGTLSNKTYGDGAFQLTATATSGLTVTYASSNPAAATVSGDMVTIIGPGSTNITASQAGDGSYNAAPDVVQPLVVDVKALTVTGAVAQNKVYDGNANASIDLTGASLTGIVGSDVVTVSGGGTFADPNVANAITVNAALSLGGADAAKYSLVQPTGLTANITQASQSITFTIAGTKTFGNAPFTLNAVATSGLPVTYISSDPAVATVSGNTVTITGAGTCTITASQAGDINYAAATDVPATLTVNKANQTITFAVLPVHRMNEAPFALTGTASSLLTVTYASSNPAVATVSGSIVTIVGVGSTTITASQTGNTNYNAATDVSRALTIGYPLLAAWDFTGPGNLTTAAATIFSSNLISTSNMNLITRGAGAAASAGINSFRTVGFQNNGISIANTDYFETTIAAGPGRSVSLSGIEANFNGTASYFATPGVTSQFAYSLDGTNFTLIGSPVTSTSLAMTPIDVTAVAALQNVANGTTITIRYYASGQTSTGGWGFSSSAAGVYGLAFTGTTTLPPAPVINSSLTDNGTVGVAYSYAITATNTTANYNPVYNATGYPAGLSINTATGVLSGTPTVAGVFNVNISATNDGGTDTKTLVLTIAPGSQSIVFNALPSKTYGDAAFTLNGIASSGLEVTYASSNPLVATVSGNTVTITGAGTTTITASQAGDANYNAALDVPQSLTVNKADQTIAFAALPNKLSSDGPFNLTATATSGLTVTYLSSNPAVATITGNTVTIQGPGNTTITASQAGDANYNAALDVPQNQLVINAALLNQTITFNTLPNSTYGDAPFQLTATASSGLTVTYASSNPSVATVSGDMVTIIAPGTTIITASQAGDGTYNFAPDVMQSLTVDVKPLTVTGAVAQNKVYDGNTNAVIDLTGASLAGIVGSDVVTVSGGGTFVSPNVANGIAVTANLSLGGADLAKYSLVQPSGILANITPGPQTITFGALPTKLTTDLPFALTAIASSGLPVSYTSSNPAVATVSGSTVTITGAGTTVITASQAGNSNYQAAVPVQQTLAVGVTVTWTFGTSLPGTAAPNGPIPAGLTISNLTQNNNNGTTTMLSNTSASNIYPGASGQVNAAAATIDGSLSAKSGTSTYFEFTLTPALQKRVTLNSISFGSRSTSTGPASYSVRSSLDAFSADIASGATPTTSTWGYRSPVTTTTTSNYGSAVTYRIYGYGGTGAAANAANWRIDDLSLSLFLEDLPACSGTPTAGTASEGANNFCLSGSTTLTLTGYTDPSTVTGIGLQWYSSTDNVSFNPIASETNPTLATGAITQTTYYYCVVSCSASGLSATSNTVTVTVNQAGNAGTVTGASSLCLSGTDTYSSDGDAGGIWSSTNPSVASVDGVGFVTALNSGTTDITYTVTGCTGPVANFVTLTVNADADAGTVTGSAVLCAGSTELFNDSGDLGGTWSSDNTSAATVDPGTGLVTAVAPGMANITYTVSSGCLSPVSASQQVTVNALPPAPGIAVVDNMNGTSTLTASGYTGTLLWSTLETINPIIVSVSGNYSVTQTVGGCTSLPASVFVGLSIAADPAVTGLDLTDLSDVSIPNANAAPLNQVLKLKIPVFNLNQDNPVPSGSTTLRIDLGSKFIVDPGFTLASASLNNYFNWTETIESGHVVIYGDQYAEIPADFDGIASFQVIANTSCSSVISANIMVDNHASSTALVDEDLANNVASLNYIIVVPAPVVSIVQPTCSTPTGTVTVSSPTAAGMTYSSDGVNYTNTTGVFTLPAGTYNITAKTVDGCVSAITIAVVDPQPATPTTILYTTVQPDCTTPTGSITITSPVGPGLTYSVDGVNYFSTTTFSGLTPGSYNVTAQPIAGCTSTITVVVIDPQPVFSGTINYTVTQPDCATQTGTITFNSPTAVGMTYSVDGLDYSNTSGVFPGLTANTSYNLTVKTAAGCISPITVATVNPAPAVPTIVLGTILSTGCSGSPVGSISVSGGGAPGLTYTITGPTVNTTGQFSGTFTSLLAGDYIVTVTSTSGCSNSVSATVVGPTGTVPDISLGSDFSSNFFFAPGDVQTVVYNVSEIAGNPAVGDTIRITKVPGYVISFNGALTANPLGITPLDNPRWKINSTNPSFVSIIFDPLQNNVTGTLNCGERVFVSIDITRNTPNISIFSLSARLRRANTETYLPNNLNSILFTAE